MKSPPQQFTDHEARERTEAFIREHGHLSPALAAERSDKKAVTPA